MAANTQPTFPNLPASQCTTFANADGTTPKQIYQPTQANGEQVNAILVSNTDGNAYNLLLYIRVGSTSFLLATISIPANAGNTSSVPAVNLIAALVALGTPLPVDAAGNPVLCLGPNVGLYAGMGSTVTAAKAVTTIAIAEEF